jgi:hypothetical protein
MRISCRGLGASGLGRKLPTHGPLPETAAEFNHRKINPIGANGRDQRRCTELHRTVEGAEGAGSTDSALTAIRLGSLRSDPPSPGHTIALAIKKGVPTEVALNRQTPTYGLGRRFGP